jgi:membrane protein YqaA with SNARE-associated domain
MMPAMAEFTFEHSYLALFLVSFLAATLLPLGSEWLLVALLLGGRETVPVVLIATVGNTLGATTNYLIGRWGSDWLIRRVLRIEPQRQRQAENWFQRYGSLSLLLSWLPVIGDPLCLVAGTLHTSAGRFLLLVSTGKALRYSTLALLTLSGSGMLTRGTP